MCTLRLFVRAVSESGRPDFMQVAFRLWANDLYVNHAHSDDLYQTDVSWRVPVEERV